MKFIQFISSCALITFIGCVENRTKQENVKTIIEKNNIDTAVLSLAYLEPLHKRKTFKNYDRSLSSYINSNPNKPDSIRKVIYLVIIGNVNPEVEQIIKEEIHYLNVFFQLEVKLMERISFDEIKNRKVKTRFIQSDEYAYYSKMKGGAANLTEQIEANSLVDIYLKAVKPKDAVAVLGITEHDLYIPKMNYIYGTSYLQNGIGLISTFRIAENDFESKVNIRKVATKQIANLFSIVNVKDYECVLNFHNNIQELRNGVLYISPIALEKLKYSIGFDYNKRFNDLKEYYKMEDNSLMADYYDACIRLGNK